MTPQAQYDDDGARRRIRESLGESLIVEASAGTGKTSELVRRIVRVLATGATTIEKIVAVTFTNKAAGELKLRVRQALDEARATADPGEIANLETALEHLEEASIGTIHSFCAQILRERPVEAVVDPAFEEVAEQESLRLYERAFRSWLQQKLGEPAPALRRAFTRLAWRESYNSRPPLEELMECGKKLIEWRDFPRPWSREEFARAPEIDALAAQTAELAALCARCRYAKDNLLLALQPAIELAKWIERAEHARPRDYDTLEGRFVRLARDLRRDRRKGTGKFADGVPRDLVLSKRDPLCQALDEFRRRADADLAASLRQEMWDVVKRYDELKSRSGKLDFVDLLLLVRDLVRRDAEVRRYLQERFSHIFIDEFQDTDPLQVEILLLLAADDPSVSDWQAVKPRAGKLFVVGDPKQSIYKFRRADVILYRQVRESLVNGGVGLVYLTRSFRAVQPIQECINAAFAPEMTDDEAAGQAAYAPLEKHAEAIGGQPCVIALPAPRPYAIYKLAKTAIDQCLPDTIVAFVEWLVRESGWKVRDLEQQNAWVPLSERHVCLLFRRFMNRGEDMTRDYVRGLEARGIPHLLVGSRSYHRREEVETLRAALSAVEWPDDELSVFAALKGSLFAISDSALLRFRHEVGRLQPLRPLPETLDPEFAAVAAALELLAALHRGRNHRPIADTVNQLLEATRAHAGFALRPAGHQVLANVYRICDLARSFETGGGISFRGFVEELESQAERQDSAEAPVLEDGSEGVRLMTVHTAKGLEFPVVILADMTTNIAAFEPDRHVDGLNRLCAMRLLHCAPQELLDHEAEEKAREAAEGVRVAYVAATRARDLLVVPAVGDEEREGWVQPLNKAIYPMKQHWRSARAAAGCPQFGEASVLARPQEFFGQPEFSVQPGLHRPRAGSHEVVWWDPGALKLSTGPTFGLRQEDILTEGGGDDGLAPYEAWKFQLAERLARGARPQFDIVIPSEMGESPPDFQCPVEIDQSLAPAAERPGGRRFGAMLHQVLRDVELSGARAEVESLARVHGRVVGATTGEVQAAIDAVVAALGHPLIERAKTAERCHREYPIVLHLDGGRLVEGVIDLAFLDCGAWTVVDFKTGADLAAKRAQYERQLHWYGAALARLTGLPVRGWLLAV